MMPKHRKAFFSFSLFLSVIRFARFYLVSGNAEGGRRFFSISRDSLHQTHPEGIDVGDEAPWEKQPQGSATRTTGALERGAFGFNSASGVQSSFFFCLDFF